MPSTGATSKVHIVTDIPATLEVAIFCFKHHSLHVTLEVVYKPLIAGSSLRNSICNTKKHPACK
jgi:hypothetical protein